MSDANAPHQHDRDDARADDGPPTDAVSDEVKSDSADLEASPAPPREDDDTDAP